MSVILRTVKLLQTPANTWAAQTCRCLAAERPKYVSVTLDPDFEGKFGQYS